MAQSQDSRAAHNYLECRNLLTAMRIDHCTSCGKPRPEDSDAAGWRSARCPPCWKIDRVQKVKRHRAKQKANGKGPIGPEELADLLSGNLRNLAKRKTGAPVLTEALELARQHGGLERAVGEGDVEAALQTLESNGYPSIRAVIAQMNAYSAAEDVDDGE